ncbi:MAG: AtpZ/AtpI family protein [Thermodesulfovibrionia bacterium]|nr:AtpZ/AtpI family protein [Thermodesulfovibrionia bacterium]
MKDTKQQPSQKKEAKREFFRLLGVASTVGINLVISTFIGLAIGWLLDNKVFNTSPWFTIIFLILGIAAGFKYLFKIVSKIDNNNSEK